MYRINISVFLLLIALAMMPSCKTDTTNNKAAEVILKDPVKIPAFSADSAYTFIQNQVDFGPRVPGTDEHRRCGEWLANKLRSYGAEVIVQDFVANIYTGDKWDSRNIIAQINPDHKTRIILSAHWDTRFMSDEDAENPEEPVLGADDGGSGVGVLLEIARIIQQNPIDLGVDIIFWDAEDQGTSPYRNETWCLGAQHWSRNKHDKNYNAKYGINLDMVGASNPSFGQDTFSKRYAKDLLDRVWKLGQRMGHSSMFKNHDTGEIVDDHRVINEMARIPMIDIINQPLASNGMALFQKCWHKKCDDMSGINKKTIGAVGQVVTAVIYKESDGSLYNIK